MRPVEGGWDGSDSTRAGPAGEIWENPSRKTSRTKNTEWTHPHARKWTRQYMKGTSIIKASNQRMTVWKGEDQTKRLSDEYFECTKDCRIKTFTRSCSTTFRRDFCRKYFQKYYWDYQWNHPVAFTYPQRQYKPLWLSFFCGLQKDVWQCLSSFFVHWQ